MENKQMKIELQKLKMLQSEAGSSMYGSPKSFAYSGNEEEELNEREQRTM